MEKKVVLLAISLVVIALLSFREARPISIWMIGDSTMAAKKAERYPESGWGVALADYDTDKAKVHNHAASGRSTLSFIAEGRWKKACDSLQKGDYVIIQFGHNDEKPDEKLHTEAFGTFKTNIKKFIDETRGKGAIPVVCSSIVRRHFDKSGNLIDTHGDYIKAAKEVALETKTVYIDMEALTRKVVFEMGPVKSKEIYNFIGKRQDSTHLNVKGAKLVAELFVKEVKRKKMPLAAYFKDIEKKK